MSDELANFFAKKAQKSKDRKKKINVGEIAECLERNAHNQENNEREEAEKQSEQPTPVADLNNDDSEWIENPDDDLTKLEELGIRGMDVSELTDEEEVEEEKVETEPKTWNFEQNNLKTPKESERAEEIAPQLKTKYVPPVNRFAGRRIVQPKIDLKSEEMFPSIEDAEKIEKELSKPEAKKNTDLQNDGWTVKGSETDKSNVYRPPQAKTIYRPGNVRESANAPQAKPTIYRPGNVRESAKAPSANKYVPPNKRAQNPW